MADFTKGVKSVAIPASSIKLVRKIGIVRARWNDDVVSSLEKGFVSELAACGIGSDQIVKLEVPGSFELPYAASSLIERHPDMDAVVCIGTLIKGETMHFEYISESVSHAIMKLGIDTGVPVIFGVLTCMTDEQAFARAGLIEGKGHNHGNEWGRAACEMAVIKRETEAAAQQR